MNIQSSNTVSGPTAAKVPKKAPDYFVGIRVSSKALQEIHKEVISVTPQAKPMILDSCESHVTLGILKVDDGSGNTNDSLQQVINGFARGACKARQAIGRLTLEFDQFDTFRGSVLFLKPTQQCGARLGDLRACVFQDEDISKYWIDNDNDRQYAPHLTIAKHSRFRRKKVQKLKFDPCVYQDIANLFCPVESEAASIQLCRIAGRKTGEYYTVIAEELLSK